MRQLLFRFALIFTLVFVLHPIVVYLWNLAFPPEDAFDWGLVCWRAFVLALLVGIILPLVERWRGKR